MNEGVGAVVYNLDGQILLGKRLFEPERGKWALIGGQCEAEEFPVETLKREVSEETLTDATKVNFLGVGRFDGADSSYLSHFFSCKLKEELSQWPLEEHSEVSWYHLSDLPKELAASARYGIELFKSQEREIVDWQISDCDALLIQPPFPLADKEALSLPLGMASLAAILREADLSVTCLDGSIPCDYDKIVELFGKDDTNRKKFTVVGVQFHSKMSFDWCVRFCRYIRRSLPHSHICGGGELANSHYAELLRDRVVDTIIFGEAETSFKNLCQSAKEHGADYLRGHDVSGTAQLDSDGKVHVSEAQPELDDIDYLPSHSVEDFRWNDYGQWTLMTSRGCPFKCMYCSSAAYWKHRIRFHSPRRVVDDLERLKSEFSAHQIYIADDTFTLRKDRVAEICRLLCAEEVGVKWSCLTRFDCVDRSLLEAMHSAGCVQISFGVDSTNAETLRLIDRKQDLARAQEIFRSCDQIGIRTRTSIVFGLPAETKQSLLATADWLSEVRPNEIQIYGLTPHDGTALFGSLDRLGVRILNDDPVAWSRDIMKPICETDKLPASVLREVANSYIRKFEELGYVYLNGLEGRKKINAEYTIATSFSPVQGIASIVDQ